MTFQQFTLCFLVYLVTGHCLETDKSSLKTLPTISNSLVNLGKMEISFYFGKPDSSADKETITPFNLPFPNPLKPLNVIEDEPCPCSQFRSKTDSLISKPSEIINKILMSNDLFKNPTSTFCCDSHERGHDSTFFFELSPNQASQAKVPFAFPVQTVRPPPKQKTLEIFLFPKRKDLANFDYTKLAPLKDVTKNIEKVGKDITFDLPIVNGKMSVKKDLNDLEKKQKIEEINKIDIQNGITTISNNTV